MKFAMIVSLLVCMLSLLNCSGNETRASQISQKSEARLPAAADNASQANPFEIGSNDLSDGGILPQLNAFNGMGCTGKNVSPEIHWSNPPAGTKSFVVTVYDPGAPTGSGFWHWMVIDIPAATSSLATGTSGANVGTVFPNDFGSAAYGGPCPPQGSTDFYTFTVYALNTEKLESLGLQSDATNAVARFFLQAGGSIIGKASFTVSYKHP